MKFSELENRVATLNLGTSNRYYAEGTEYRKTVIYLDYGIRFDIRPDSALYVISEEYVGRMQDTNSAISLPVKDRLALQKLAYKYSRTPLDKRRDEPKFRVKMLPGDIYSYLHQSNESKRLFLFNSNKVLTDKTIFTKSGYDKIQKDYPQWLPKFDENDPHFDKCLGWKTPYEIFFNVVLHLI
uniref:hypothetical protein n=1 Tax=Lentilactobacillus hilgardii TaxID=1588 RepID=UPI00403EF707